MKENIKDKAGRYRALSKDETFIEVLNKVKQNQVSVFLSTSSSEDAIDTARSVVLALEEIESVIQSVLDEEAVFDKKFN